MMAAMPDNDRPTDKPIPLGVALAVMAALLIAGGGLIWKYVYRPPAPPHAIRAITPLPGGPRAAGNRQTDDQAFSAAALAAATEATLPDGPHPRDGQVLFKAGDAYLRAVAVDGQDTYSFGFFTLSEAEWDHGYLTQGVRRLLSQDDFARELDATDPQRAALRELPDPPPAKWPHPDRDRFVTMYKAWQNAPDPEKSRAASQLVDALRAYGHQKRVKDQETMTARVRQIRSILNERQIAKINPIPRWNTPATTRAATRP